MGAKICLFYEVIFFECSCNVGTFSTKKLVQRDYLVFRTAYYCYITFLGLNIEGWVFFLCLKKNHIYLFLLPMLGHISLPCALKLLSLNYTPQTICCISRPSKVSSIALLNCDILSWKVVCKHQKNSILTNTALGQRDYQKLKKKKNHFE